MTAPTVWEYTETAPEWASPLVALWSWGLNCERWGNPWLAFLDLVGYSADELGCDLLPWADPDRSFGWMELGYLADALTVYADRPAEVIEWVNGLHASDT